MYSCRLEPRHLQVPVFGEVGFDVDEVSAGLDLDYSRLLVDPLVLGLTLNLGRHLDQQLDFVADARTSRRKPW